MLAGSTSNSGSRQYSIRRSCPFTNFERKLVTPNAGAVAASRRYRSRNGPRPEPGTQGQLDQTDHLQEVVVGIDLGTTNSAIARLVDGKPVCILNQQGDTLTPSVVSFLPDGSTVVGRSAKQQDPQSTYYSVKRLIGRQFVDPAVQEERTRLAYKVDC